LTRENVKNRETDPETTLNKVRHLVENYTNEKNCSLYAKLSKKAVSFLKTASKKGITVNKDGSKSQKELTGELEIEKVVRQGEKIIYIIDVNRGSIESGDEEDVNVVATRYNFHSHPEEAYVRHSVEKAWPSVTDYLGYLKLGKNTIFHCVATLEGVYIINFGKHWGNRLKEVSRKFVSKHYDINHKMHYSPEVYIQKINKILFKGYPIYVLHFFRWENAEAVFKVDFPFIQNSCLVSQEIVDKHGKIHSKM
jgi:hypothetical protein